MVGLRVGSQQAALSPAAFHPRSPSCQAPLTHTLPLNFSPCPKGLSFFFWKVCLLWNFQICFSSSRYSPEPCHSQTSQPTSVIPSQAL